MASVSEEADGTVVEICREHGFWVSFGSNARHAPQQLEGHVENGLFHPTNYCLTNCLTPTLFFYELQVSESLAKQKALMLRQTMSGNRWDTRVNFFACLLLG
jgi:hypothetical protein